MKASLWPTSAQGFEPLMKVSQQPGKESEKGRKGFLITISEPVLPHRK